MRQAHVLFTVFLIGALQIRIDAQTNVPAPGQSLWEWHSGFLDDPNNLVDPEEEGSLFHQHERFMEVWTPRLYPSGNFSIAEEGVKDYLEWYSLHSKTDVDFDSDWHCLGPFDSPNPRAGIPISNTGTGQIHAIAFHPDYGNGNEVIYAASGYGGVFKTYDAGQHWTPISDNAFPVAGVTDIEIDPFNPERIYVATGNVDAGAEPWTAGVFRSNDGGITWENISTGLVDGVEAHVRMKGIALAPGSSGILMWVVRRTCGQLEAC